MEANVMVNTLWVIMAGILVFFMNAGFALVESGLCRAKNTVNILAKNFIVFGFAVIGYWSIGYAMMFGPGNSMLGTEGFFLDSLPMFDDSGLHLYAMFFFQLCFAVTAATIVSGAVAERIKIHAFIMFSILLTTIIYPIIGHWAWGGGWLSEMGFADFAGSTVVHSVGGWAGLVGAIVLGPRIGKYDKKGNVRPIPGHNLAFVTLGGLVLWLGWFGFNGGTQLAIDAAVPHIIIATALSAAFGTVTATAWSWLRVGKPDLTLIVNGMLGGLVGITAGCDSVPIWSAAIIGSCCGVLVIESVMFFDRVKVDDPVGAISVHLVCGVMGTLLTGVFMAEKGLIAGGGFSQLGVQAVGIAAIGGFTVVVGGVGWLLLNVVMGVRVTPEEEIVGLDISEHGMEAYPRVHGRIDRDELGGDGTGGGKATAALVPG